MKQILLAIIFLQCVPFLHAEDWTTTDGKTYHDVKVIRSDASTVTILDADGGATIALEKLSPTLQKRFNYDPVAAAAQIDAQKKLAAIQGHIDNEERIRKEFLSHAYPGSANVIQVLPDGILASGEYGRGSKEFGPSPTYLGTIYIECATDGLVDGASWSGPIWPVGTYSYVAVDGARSTIPRYTTILASAITYYKNLKQ